MHKLELERKLRLYSLLLKKYANLINASEKKTIGEVKALINPNDLTIQAIISNFKPEPYNFEFDFLSTAEKIFNFLKKEIDFVKADIDLSYWLTPAEIMKAKVADDEDLAVLFCSILYALGDENAFVVIAELEDLSNHAFVVTKFNELFFIFDLSQKHSFNEFAGSEIQVLQKYSFNGAKIKDLLYKFNAKEYKQFI